MRDILRRLGGPDSISFNAWLILAPISIFFTQEVAPEGYSPDYSYLNGLAVGFLGHAVTGAVLFLGWALVLSRSQKPKPLVFLFILALAGGARGVSVSFLMEALGVVSSADYAERIRSGVVLIVVWFGVAGLVSDARASYRRSYASLVNSISEQLQIRTSGELLIQQSRDEILDQIKATLAQALRLGAKAGDIHLAVDDLVRPLSHRLASDLSDLRRVPVGPKRTVKLYPVLQTAFSKTAYHPLAVALMAVLGTLASRIWSLGPQAFLVSISDLIVIWLGLWLAHRIGIKGFGAIVAWFSVGFASAAVADLLVNPQPFSDPISLIYFSVNVVGPALLFALLAAYDEEANKNLGLLQVSLRRLEWETQALRQRLWLERKRLSRFVHSELQSRLRSFALRFEFQGAEPNESDLIRLRNECEAALVFDDEQKPLSDQLRQTVELWRGVVDCHVEIPFELLDLIERDPYASSALAELIREALSNSVKHGRASKVEISCKLESESDAGAGLVLVISDDGNTELEAKQGLGSSMFNEVTSEYSLTRESGSTVLRARLPIRIAEHQIDI
jgi:signal transduction histidine kinase